MTLPLNPGSPEAVAVGCTCPVIDNRRGKGAYLDADDTPLFWYSPECPVHVARGMGTPQPEVAP